MFLLCPTRGLRGPTLFTSTDLREHVPNSYGLKGYRTRCHDGSVAARTAAGVLHARALTVVFSILPVLFLLVGNHDPPTPPDGRVVGDVSVASNFIARVHDHDGLQTHQVRSGVEPTNTSEKRARVHCSS